MRGIELLHPDIQSKARELQALCVLRNLPLLITDTWRTREEQTALYAQGRTTAGTVVTNCRYPESPHCWGVAFDFCRNVKGREYDNGDKFFNTVGALAKSIGLFWGGDFKGFVDMPHLEHPGYLPSNSVNTLIGKYGTPEKFRALWPVSPPTLRKGNTGEYVKTLQRLLGGLDVDGSFGPKTDNAVKTFQAGRNLVADGIVGAKTWAALGVKSA